MSFRQENFTAVWFVWRCLFTGQISSDGRCSKVKALWQSHTWNIQTISPFMLTVNINHDLHTTEDFLRSPWCLCYQTHYNQDDPWSRMIILWSMKPPMKDGLTSSVCTSLSVIHWAKRENTQHMCCWEYWIESCDNRVIKSHQNCTKNYIYTTFSFGTVELKM